MTEDASRTEDLGRLIVACETALARRDPSLLPSGIGVGLEDLIDDDFLEVGVSGRSWDAPAIRQRLRDAGPTEAELEDTVVVTIAPAVVLLTYRIRGSRPSARCSLWVLRDGAWRVRYHQGTVVG